MFSTLLSNVVAQRVDDDESSEHGGRPGAGLGFLAGYVSLGNPARGWGIPTYLHRYLVKVVTKVYYLVSRPAEDTYIPPTGVTQSYLPR